MFVWIQLFHFRLLLLAVKGAKSLQNVNGEIHDTFVATCVALGVIDDEDERERAMNEAVMWMML